MNDVVEARADYTSGGRIKYNYPVETCICPAFFRRRFTLTERDTILLAILMQYAQTQISIEEFGLQLGFAVRENRQHDLYKDPAETKILHYLLEELAVYNLIQLGKDCIELSPDGLTAHVSGHKYLYYKDNLVCYQDQPPGKTEPDFSFAVNFGLNDAISYINKIKADDWVQASVKDGVNDPYWLARAASQYQAIEEIEVLAAAAPVKYNLRQVVADFVISLSEPVYAIAVETDSGPSSILTAIIRSCLNFLFPFDFP